MPDRCRPLLRVVLAGVLTWSGPVSAAQMVAPEVLREQAVEEAITHASTLQRPTWQRQPVRETAMQQALQDAPKPSPQSSAPGFPPTDSPTPGEVVEGRQDTGQLPPGEFSGAANWLNQRVSPLKVSGEVRSMAGITRDDFILQEANGDLNERNFRILSGPFRYNTFDPRVFSRTVVNLDTNETTNWQLHSNMTVDPWSFVGKTDRFTVVGQTPTDTVELELKWWSATNTAINETFLTQNNGDSIATPEIEVSEGRTVPTAVTSTFSNTFRIPSAEIDYMFQPIRWLWGGYQNDVVDFRVFPLALEDQALTSEDPLRLSNHHIYWEPSPWLDEWRPGRVNTGATPDDFTRGEWSDTLASFTKDSELRRLTALRGTSFQWNLSDETSLQAAVASPKGLWQEYERFDSFVGMAHLKQTLFDDRLSLGGLVTNRWAYAHRRKDATNHVYALDASSSPWAWLTWEGEMAVSKSIQDRVTAYESDARGWAWHQALTTRWSQQDDQLTGRLFYTHMDEGFDPGLANYRHTRDDQFWGRHLALKPKPRLLLQLNPEAATLRHHVEAVRIGDGMDVGRDVLGLRVKGTFFEERFEPLVDLRNVHRANGKYLETVVREENTAMPSKWLTFKTLVLYHDLPHTTGGLDPFIVNNDDDRPFANTAIVDDRDPSLLTFSLGSRLMPMDAFAVWGAWERTNDTTVATGDFPRGLLNSSSFSTINEDDQVIRIEAPFLYSQGFFPQPPYPFFDIFRAGLYFAPRDDVEVAFDWTRNEFEHAGQIDDNLNHIGLTTTWAPLPRMIVIGRYVMSWAVDIADENSGAGKRYARRHSLYGQLAWRVTDSSSLSLEFGEAAVGLGFNPLVFTVDPLGDYYPVLDTEHLVRIVYTSKF